MMPIDEAFEFQSRLRPVTTDGQLTLSNAGWSWDEEGYTRSQIRELLTFLIENNYTCNGGQIKRQIKGMPMWMPTAPQIANLACYPVERDHAYELGPHKTALITRFVDDFWSNGVPLPSPAKYGMEYIVTGEGDSVVYLGVKVYIKKANEEEHLDHADRVHLTLYDREQHYPHHIVRYPEFGTVAPNQQLGGV